MSTEEPRFLGTVRLADLPTLAVPAEPLPIPIQRLDEVAEATPNAPPPIGTLSGPPPFTATLGFTAMTFANASGAPPDVSVAVGVTHVVETIKPRLRSTTSPAAWLQDRRL